MGEGSSSDINLAPATEVLKSLVEALQGFVEENASVIFGVATAFIVFWLLRIGLRIMKSFAKA